MSDPADAFQTFSVAISLLGPFESQQALLEEAEGLLLTQGWETTRNVLVKMPGGKSGRLDLVARRLNAEGGEISLAIEIGRKNPRVRSLRKLAFARATHRLVILRQGGGPVPITRFLTASVVSVNPYRS